MDILCGVTIFILWYTGISFRCNHRNSNIPTNAWIEGSEFFPFGNILPFIFFFSSFFFVVSTYFPRYTFLIGCGILILVYIIISIAWPQAVWWNPDNMEIPTPFMVYFLILAVLALPLSYFRIRCLHQDEEETASEK